MAWAHQHSKAVGLINNAVFSLELNDLDANGYRELASKLTKMSNSRGFVLGEKYKDEMQKHAEELTAKAEMLDPTSRVPRA